MLHSAAFTVAVVLLFCCPLLIAVHQSMEYGAQKRKFYAHPVRQKASQTNIQQGYSICLVKKIEAQYCAHQK